MQILLINTAGAAGGVVALADESGVLAEQALPGRGTSEALLPAVRRLLPTGVAGLDAVGVCIGPGSFTGVRVGLAAAKGICEAAGCGMVAMSRLALVAAALEGDRKLAVLDGGRGEYYCGVYEAGETPSETLVTAEKLEEMRGTATLVTCEALVAERLGAETKLVTEPGAEALRVMVLARIAAGEWSDVATVDANYLRRTDAEVLKDKASA